MDELLANAHPFVVMWKAICHLNSSKTLCPSTLHAAINRVLNHHDDAGYFFHFINQNTQWDGAILVQTSDAQTFRNANYAFIAALKRRLHEFHISRQLLLNAGVVG